MSSLVGIARAETVELSAHASSAVKSFAVHETAERRLDESQPSALVEVATAVVRQDTQAAPGQADEVQTGVTTAAGDRKLVTTRDADDDDGYSSFGGDDYNNEEENEKLTGDKAKAKAKAKASARKQHLLDEDNGNESEEVAAPERTTASDSRESKVFLRAVYRADMRTIQGMLTSRDASVTTADQVGSVCPSFGILHGRTERPTLVSLMRTCVVLLCGFVWDGSTDGVDSTGQHRRATRRFWSCCSRRERRSTLWSTCVVDGEWNCLYKTLSEVRTHQFCRGAYVYGQINGWTPLHVAAVRELLPCVQLLLRAEASARINDKYGDSASDILRSVRGKKREKVLQMLLQFAPRSGA